MTVKKHTPSGAQNSTSARTKNRPADPPDDELTAERIRAILSDPGVKQSVKDRAQKLVGELYNAGEWDTLPETPEYFVLLFEQTFINDHLKRGTAEPAEREIYDRLAAVIDRHEPQAYKVARRCAEIYADWLGRKKGRKYPDGAHYFIEHVDAVLEGGDGLLPNPDSKYFVPLFVEAFNERGPRDRHVRKLLDLIKRVDAGADLNALYDEDRRKWQESAAAHKPKDARLVDRLSEVIADPKREDDQTAVLDAINTLSNTVCGVYDFHPDVFPVLASVMLREARRCLKGEGRQLDRRARRVVRDSLRALETIAGE